MATDRQLSRNFWLHEFPCWQRASEDDVERLQETVARVLQPARAEWGRIAPTSWRWWSDGCELRTGAHRYGGTVDFAALDAPTRDVWEWGARYLLPAGFIGRWIYEPETDTQGPHIHMAPVEDMVAHNGDSRIQALEEVPDPDGGTRYVLAREIGIDGEGSYTNPIYLPGVGTTVTAGRGGWWLLALGLLMLFNLSGQATGGLTPDRT